MSDYKVRDGIVLESICGKYVLISTEAAREECDYIRKIDDIVAYYWEMMEQELTIDQMVEKASGVFTDIDSNVIQNDILNLIEQLKNAGYLLKDDED